MQHRAKSAHSYDTDGQFVIQKEHLASSNKPLQVSIGSVDIELTRRRRWEELISILEAISSWFDIAFATITISIYIKAVLTDIYCSSTRSNTSTCGQVMTIMSIGSSSSATGVLLPVETGVSFMKFVGED